MKICLFLGVALSFVLPLFGQTFTLIDTFKTPGKIQNIHLSSDQDALFVLQSYILTKYDLTNPKSVKIADIVLGGGGVVSASKYITQSNDSLFFKDMEQQTNEIIRFDKFKIMHMSCDRKGETIVVAGLEQKTGLYLISKDRTISRLPFEPDISLTFISRLIVSDNGELLAIQSFNKEFEYADVQIFNLKTGKMEGKIDPTLSYRFQFFSNSRQLMTLSYWGGMRVYNIFPFIAETGISFSEGAFGKHDDESIDAFTLFRNDTIAVTCSENGLLSAWDTRDESKYHAQPLEFSKEIAEMRCSKKYTVISFKDSLIAFYKTPNLLVTKKSSAIIEPVTQNNHFGWVKTVIEDSVSNYIYTHSGDESATEEELKVWDRSTLLQVKSLPGFTGKINFDGRYITSNKRIFDTETLADVTPELLKRDLFMRIIKSDYTTNSFFAEDRDTLQELNLYTTKKIRTVIVYQSLLSKSAGNQKGSLGNIALDKEKGIVASAIHYGFFGEEIGVTLHSLSDGSLLKILRGHNSFIKGLLFHPSKEYLITYQHNELIVWDIRTGDSLMVIVQKNEYDQPQDIYSCTFSIDNKYLVIGYGSGYISFWNIETRRKEKLYDFKKMISAIHFINTETAIIASYSDLFLYDFSKSVVLYEMSNKMKLEGIEKILVDEKNDILYSLTDNRLSSWNFKSLLNFSTPDISSTLPRYLRDIAFNPDSSLIICTDFEKNPNVYDIRKGLVKAGEKRELEPFHRFEGLCSVSLRNGNIITATRAGWGSDSGTLLIFDRNGGLLKNLWNQEKLIIPYNVFLLPDPRENYVYFNATIKDIHYLFRLDLRSYNVTRIFNTDSYSTHYMCFVNDSILLIAGNHKLLLNVNTNKLYAKAKNSHGNAAYYDPVSGILFSASSSSIRLSKLYPFIYEFKSFNVDYTNYITYSSKRQEIITGNEFGEIVIYDFPSMNKKFAIVPLDTLGYALFTSDGYYYANKNIAPQILAFKKDNKIFVFDQFDRLLNRPDMVIRYLSAADSNEAYALKRAYEKRIKKQNAFFITSSPDQPIETLEIKNKSALPSVTSDADYTFLIGSGGNIDNQLLIIVDNGVTILEKKISELKRINNDIEVTVTLSEGTNKMAVYTLTNQGRQSVIQQLQVVYSPAKPTLPKTYFVGIGINRFMTEKYNLRYSMKDIRDLAVQFASKGAIITDTLYDQNVTIENVKSIHEKLKYIGINDKVIIAYSGHGLLSKKFDYYLSTYNTNFDKPEENGLPYEDLENLLDSIPARKKLLLIDACHSGEVDKDDLEMLNSVTTDSVKGIKPVAYKKDGQLGLKNSFELMQELFVNVGKSTGATIISAAAGTQFALERGDLKNGVFTYSILEAMQKNKTLKVSELKTIVGRRVQELTKGMQKPTSRNENIAIDWNVW